MRSAAPLPFLVLAALLCAGGPAAAEWVAGRAERLFGPETPESEACGDAAQRAREDAVRHRLGERVAAEDMLVCTERGDAADCSTNRSVWSTVDGDIRAVRQETSTTTDGPVPGFRKCAVTLEADVVTAAGQPDPGFDIAVRVDPGVFRDGESMTLALEPTRPMHVAVFQWLPYEKGDRQVTRLFPNAKDPDGRIAGPATIPTRANQARYAMKVAFPGGQPAAKRMVDEYLLVVGTKTAVAFRDGYSLDEFRARLLEIPRPDSRLVKRGYSVVRGQ
jgi:hypothetical protein